MSGIEAAVHRIVSQLPGYESRPQQVEMAREVEQAIAERRHLIVEAGTGSGKSFGYLIPLLASGQKAVVSTGTIALQEQLLHKDLPFLQKATGRPIRVALAKGRGNYVCLRKLHEVDRTLSPADPHRVEVSQLIALARERRWTGDRADLPFNPDFRFWNDALGSDGDDCLGPRCSNFLFTPHRLARIACEDADLVIANHALYFTDLATEAGVLPQHEVVVFDEAHHLERAAVGALTVSVTRWDLTRLLQRIQRRFPAMPLALMQRLVEAEAAVLEQIFRRGHGQFPVDGDAGLARDAAEMAAALATVSDWIAGVDPAQMKLFEDDAQARAQAELQRDLMAAAVGDLADRWSRFAELSGDPAARAGAPRANWMRVDPRRDFFELHSAPLEVGPSLRELLWKRRTCILTSATLAVDGGFAYLKAELGMEAAEEAVLGSPFRFEEQALLYVPRALPLPSAPEYLDAITAQIEQILAVCRGRAFVLFTSYRALRHVAGALVPRLPWPCKTQEDLPRQRLLEWFRTTPNSVLFATATFWEGVDIPGEALSCVIIDKLPFASPDDPVVQARTDRMRAADEDWFNGFMLPRAILSLKQGFGRLIRSRADVGLIAILDRRLLTMRYGDVILRSLPPARRIQTLPESLDAAFAGRRARTAA